MQNSYSDNLSCGTQMQMFDDYTGYFDVRNGRPFEMPDIDYTHFGKNRKTMPPACDEGVEEQLYEKQMEQALDKLMRYGS